MILVSIGHKECIKCDDIKPLGEFNVNRQSRDGRRHICKTCSSAASSKYRLANKEKCAATIKKWGQKNRDKVRAYVAKHKALHPESVKMSREKNKEKSRASVKARNTKWRLKNLDKKAANSRTYRAKNRSKVSAINARYRANKRQAVPSWSDFDLIRDMYAEARYNKMQVDHIVPLQSKFVCGLHCEANLQILSAKDNVKKGNRAWPEM